MVYSRNKRLRKIIRYIKYLNNRIEKERWRYKEIGNINSQITRKIIGGNSQRAWNTICMKLKKGMRYAEAKKADKRIYRSSEKKFKKNI